MVLYSALLSSAKTSASDVLELAIDFDGNIIMGIAHRSADKFKDVPETRQVVHLRRLDVGHAHDLHQIFGVDLLEQSSSVLLLGRLNSSTMDWTWPADTVVQSPFCAASLSNDATRACMAL